MKSEQQTRREALKTILAAAILPALPNIAPVRRHYICETVEKCIIGVPTDLVFWDAAPQYFSLDALILPVFHRELADEINSFPKVLNNHG